MVVALFWLLAVGCYGPDAGADERLQSAPRLAAASEVAKPEGNLCGGTSLPQHAFVDLGHRAQLTDMVRAGDRIVTRDWSLNDEKRWILWDAATGLNLASGGNSSWSVDLAGSTLFELGSRGLVLRDARDGRERVNVALEVTSRGWHGGLSRDGTYAYLASDVAVRVWDLDGRLLLNRPGRYEDAQIYAGAAALQIGNGPLSGIETLPIAGGEARTSAPYAGRFNTWFVDGRHFVTLLPAAFQVYTAAGTLVLELPFPANIYPPWERAWVGGNGAYVWTQRRDRKDVTVYHVSSPEPVLSFAGAPTPGDARQTRFAFDLPAARKDWSTLRVLTLDEGGPTWVDREVPFEYISKASIEESDRWVLGSYDGAVVQGDGDIMASLGCGGLKSLAASEASNRLAVGTADRKVRVLALTDHPRLTHTLSLPRDTYGLRLGFAAKGQLLVVGLSHEVRAFALDDAATEIAWETGRLLGEFDFATARHADRLATSACSTSGLRSTCSIAVKDRAGHVLWETPPVNDVTHFGLSPDGEKLAINREWQEPIPPPTAFPFRTARQTLIYDRYRQTGALDGPFHTWIDADRLMVGRSDLVDVQGRPASPNDARPQLYSTRFSSDNPTYFYDRGLVYRTEDGKEVWSPRRFYPGGWNLGAATIRYFTGQAMLGERVVLGSESYLYLDEVSPLAR